MKRLSDTKAKRTRPGKYDKWLADGNGLYLRITPAGSRLWYFRQTRRGRRLQDRLSSLDDYTLAEARLIAAKKNTAAAGSASVSELAERWFTDVIESEYRRPHHVLGHTLPGVMAVYNRAEYELERIEATKKWAKELDRILSKRTKK